MYRGHSLSALLLVVSAASSSAFAQSTPPASTPPPHPASAAGSKPKKEEPKNEDGENGHPEKLTRDAVDTLIENYDAVALKADKSGQAQGVGLGVGTELVQILGEIVVDRATSEAYRLIETKVATALSCGKKGSVLTATCDVVTSIRIQDLASAPAALRMALITDATRLVTAKLEQVKYVKDHLVLIRDIVLPALTRPGSFDTTVAATIVEHFVRYALARKTTEFCKLPSAEGALIVAGLAVAACESSGNEKDCPLAAIVETLDCQDADKWPALADRARSLAAKMLVALHARSGSSASDIDVRARLRAALEVAFDYLCEREDENLGCSGTSIEARNLAILRSIALGAIDDDSNAIVAAVIRFAKAELSNQEHLPRGLRIVGALLDYASTYLPQKGAFDKGEGGAEVAKAAHEKRKKILESLTAEMTNRTERAGDWIWSAGGSLRAVVGKRMRNDHDDPTWVPLQLTLGFAIDKLFADYAAGIHLELGVLDLGQYVSFDEDNSVREPDFADALAPTATLAFFLGRSLPFQMGFTGAYAPQFEYEDGKRGSWSLGLTAGIYVPLFDIN